MANGVLSEVDTLKGTISGQDHLVGSLDSSGALTGVVSLGYSGGYPSYSGPYRIDPTFEAQILQTADHIMLQDMEITAIEVSRVSNPSGGVTVYIGGVY